MVTRKLVMYLAERFLSLLISLTNTNVLVDVTYTQGLVICVVWIVCKQLLMSHATCNKTFWRRVFVGIKIYKWNNSGTENPAHNCQKKKQIVQFQILVLQFICKRLVDRRKVFARISSG